MKSKETFSALNSVSPAAVVADSRSGVATRVPLSRLFLSESNVRKSRNPQGIPELAAQIASQGLLYPLCVIEDVKKGKPSGRYGVTAGGRRLAALGLLVSQGHMGADDPIECLVFPAERAVSLSLAENSHEAMHPADTIEAFKRLIEEGKAIPEIAGQFGVSELTVERRLKLASLAPMFLDLYRAGTIEPKQLQALALTNDQALQVEAWQSLPSYDRSAYRIRQALTNDELSGSDKMVRFVGLDAYKQAGGAVRVDLFGGDGDCYIQDPQIINTLAGVRLQALAEEVRAEGWKWVEVMPEFGYQDQAKFSRIYAKATKPSADEQFEIDELDGMVQCLRGAISKLEQEAESEGDDAEATEEQQAVFDDLEDQLSNVGDFRNALTDGLKQWAPAQMKSAGVVLTVTEEGALSRLEGFVRAEDRKASGASGGGSSYSPPVKVKAVFSEKLLFSLTAHKTAAVSASLIDNPHVALVAMLHRMICEDYRSYSASPIKISLTDSGHRVGELAANFGDSPAAKVIADAKDRWGAKLPGEAAALFKYLLSQDQNTLVELLASQVARSFDVTQGRETGTRGFDTSGAVVEALGLDMADWWTPSPALYLEHVSKAKMIEAVTEACGEAAARDIPKMKKPEAVAAACAKLEGTRWLPTPLRIAVPKAADEAEAEAQDASDDDQDES